MPGVGGRRVGQDGDQGRPRLLPDSGPEAPRGLRAEQPLAPVPPVSAPSLAKPLALEPPVHQAPCSTRAWIRGSEAWREAGSAHRTFTCFLYQSLSGTTHLPRILG